MLRVHTSVGSDLRSLEHRKTTILRLHANWYKLDWLNSNQERITCSGMDTTQWRENQGAHRPHTRPTKSSPARARSHQNSQHRLAMRPQIRRETAWHEIRGGHAPWRHGRRGCKAGRWAWEWQILVLQSSIARESGPQRLKLWSELRDEQRLCCTQRLCSRNYSRKSGLAVASQCGEGATFGHVGLVRLRTWCEVHLIVFHEYCSCVLFMQLEKVSFTDQLKSFELNQFHTLNPCRNWVGNW